jgi:hypothetical protein
MSIANIIIGVGVRRRKCFRIPEQLVVSLLLGFPSDCFNVTRIISDLQGLFSVEWEEDMVTYAEL